MNRRAEPVGRDDFRTPGVEHRSIPFWAWNARLEPEEIASQVRSFKAAGMGGFFMHSREGLETPFLGASWMEAVRVAVETAKEEGLYAWLYDEDRWPSGSAAGKVPALGDAYRAKGLTLEVSQRDYEPDRVVALFRAEVEAGRLRLSKRLDPALSARAEAGSTFLIFRIEVAAKDEWFNGEAPPDNLNPETVDAFLDRNYRPYLEAIGDEFGGTVPGIFTDEPSVHDRHSRYAPGRGWIPWTYRFAEFFREKRGYDPFDDIPLVFFDGPDQARMRHDYWRTVSELFSESYTKRIADWCERRGLIFTGHFLWENQLGTATRTGGAIMPHYRFQRLPGIDLLCEQIEETITVKQCTSVANQYGRGRVLSETYGCTGWEFSFEGQKWIGDWQYALGINLRCQHLALYSLRGCRKRDYPPVFNYNTTWWRHARVVEDYFARLGAALSEGRPLREVLVLHPATTAWCLLGSNPRGSEARDQDGDIPELNRRGDDFNRFLRAVLGAHYDFDLGDETIMAETGRVVGDRLVVNLASYRLVVLPPLVSMLRSTFDLVMAFLGSGGHVVAVKPGATMLEGRPSVELDLLYRHPNTRLVEDEARAIPAIEALLPRKISLRGLFLTEDPALLCMYREVGKDRATLFAVNTDRSAGRDVVVEVAGGAEVEEIERLTGELGALEVEVAEGRTRFAAHFGPAGSRLYSLRLGAAPGPGRSAFGRAAYPPTRNFLVEAPILGALGPTAAFSRTAPNALVLDRCSYDLDGRGWSEGMEVWRTQKEIRAALGMRQIYYNGLAQRYLWAGDAHPRDGTPVRLRFAFSVKDLPQGDFWLVLEDPDAFEVSLNGKKVETLPSGWFLDKSFEKLRLPPPALGENELVLSCGYKNRMELEDCFLLGDFAVDGERALAREPKALRFGDWCLQGYPHYCGSMVYRFQVAKPAGRAFLRLGDFSAVTIEVRVNGTVAGQIPWRAVEGLELSGLMREESNVVEIEVVGSPRNLLGPLHLARGKVFFDEWSAFRPEGTNYTPDYVLQPYGLFGQATLSET